MSLRNAPCNDEDHFYHLHSFSIGILGAGHNCFLVPSCTHTSDVRPQLFSCPQLYPHFCCQATTVFLPPAVPTLLMSGQNCFLVPSCTHTSDITLSSQYHISLPSCTHTSDVTLTSQYHTSLPSCTHTSDVRPQLFSCPQLYPHF